MAPEECFACGCPRTGFATCLAGPFEVRRTLSTPSCSLRDHEHAGARLVLTLRAEFATRHGRWNAKIDPDRLLFRPAGDGHRDDYTEPTMCLSFSIAERDAAASRLGSSPFMLAERFLAELTRDVSRELDRSDALSPFVIEALGAELLAIALRGRDVRETRPQRWVGNVRALLEDSGERLPSLREIASAVDREPSHVAASFKRHYGTTMGRYVRTLRLRRARLLLRKAEVSLAAAAHLSGFADQSHFSRAFKQQYFVTPGEYRRRINE